jgi:hypothetical protein
MVYFQTKNPNLGKFVKKSLLIKDVGLFCVNLVDFTAIWCILWLLGIFYRNLVYFWVIWYIFPRFGML